MPTPPPPLPDNALDIVADHPAGPDGTPAWFDVCASQAMMPARLRETGPPPHEFTTVLEGCNVVIKQRTKSEGCSNPIYWLKVLVIILTCSITLGYFISQPFAKLEKCEPVVKKWEKYNVVVRFYKGVPQQGHGVAGCNNTVRVWFVGEGGGPVF